MKTKSKDKPRPFIARVSNYNAKSKLYKTRLNLRNADLQDLGAEKIFINWWESDGMESWAIQRGEKSKEKAQQRQNVDCRRKNFFWKQTSPLKF